MPKTNYESMRLNFNKKYNIRKLDVPANVKAKKGRITMTFRSETDKEKFAILQHNTFLMSKVVPALKHKSTIFDKKFLENNNMGSMKCRMHIDDQEHLSETLNIYFA